ncbi:OLC1v1004804C1 [Oldenlandia corymbosa var. corymbosa]|uniref:OLC1v1004804C1 n=1 Tax=Oldenlandia corymbosa var. corymbosa TaxID=529605 RepID=A0AAV1DD72_OLDCO|nr:OLC1v1004804C1 [Oldenlandia corymbosa var. corymbosa]
MSLSLLLPTFLILTTFFLLTKWLQSRPKNLPPSPPKLPIIGNLHQLGYLPYRSLKSLAEKYGPIMLLHLGSKPTLIISSPELAEMILKTHDLDFSNMPTLKFQGRISYNFRTTLFAPYGEYWRQLRSICVHQLLSNKRVQSFRSVREDEVALMLERITESYLSRSPVNLREVFSALANNIISRIAIGKRYSGEQNGSNFKKLFEEVLEVMGCFNIGDYVPWLGWINHLNGLEAKVNRVAKELDEYLETIVEEGLKRKEKIINGSESDQEGDQNQKNLLDVLLELKEKKDTGHALQPDSIKAIIMDMFIGGTDSTATLLELAMSELVRNKNSLTKLKNEVRSFANGTKSNRVKITDDDLESLPFLKAVIRETCRMHPPGPILTRRESKNDVNIMGYDIPAATRVFINVFAIGMDSNIWEDVDEFRPERFLNSSIDLKGQHFELIPFGAGRRSCPGNVFGLATVGLALANLVLKFDFGLPCGAKLEDLDMSEVPSIVTRRKMPLVLEASLPNCN